MKPDCRRVLSQIASYSVEELSADDINAFTRHLDDCPPCKGHWVLFEKTLTTLSQVGETEVSVHQSQKMWLTCLEHAQNKAPALAEDAASDAGSDSHHKVEVLPHPFRCEDSQREGDRRSLSASRNGDFGWLQGLKSRLRPNWGLALAGGAAAILAATLLASPAPSSAPVIRSAVALPVVPEAAHWASFQTPPHATTGLIDYHSTMSFEPFSDHVAPTLVSYTATQP